MKPYAILAALTLLVAACNQQPTPPPPVVDAEVDPDYPDYKFRNGKLVAWDGIHWYEQIQPEVKQENGLSQLERWIRIGETPVRFYARTLSTQNNMHLTPMFFSLK